MSAKRTVDAALTTQSRVRLGASQAVICHPHRCLPHKLLPPFPVQVPPRDLEHRPQLRENQFKVTLAIAKLNRNVIIWRVLAKSCAFLQTTYLFQYCQCANAKFLYGFEQSIVKAAA